MVDVFPDVRVVYFRDGVVSRFVERVETACGRVGTDVLRGRRDRDDRRDRVESGLEGNSRNVSPTSKASRSRLKFR